MTDADRIEGLLDLVAPDRSAVVNAGPPLAVLGLAEEFARGRYRPTRAGWALLGDKGRAYQTR